MSHYIMELRRYLMFECACVTSRGGKEGVFDYTQKKFAFHSISRTGGKISEANVARIYASGYFWADNSEEIIYVFLTIFLYLLKCPQSLIL